MPTRKPARKAHNRTITDADKAAAARLRAMWDETPKERRGTQADAAEAWGDHANQSLISQYLRGELALNYAAVLFFASYLGRTPYEIRSDLPEQRHVPYPQPAYGSKLGSDHVSDAPIELALLERALYAVELAIKDFGKTIPIKAKALLIFEAYKLFHRDGTNTAMQLVQKTLKSIALEGEFDGDRQEST